MTQSVDWFTKPPGDSRGTSPKADRCSQCGGPRTWPDQRYCRGCRKKYNAAWRAEQAALRAQLPEAVRRLVVMAGELRASCTCPPTGQCGACADRRARARELTEVANLIAPLARG